MRNLRTENLRFTNEITKLSEKNTEAQRRLDIATASENAMKRELKSAEASIRGLKDDLTRTKALVAQSRTSCANDVRRRDRQIDTLKKQLAEAGRARGSRPNPAITTITVTGSISEPVPSPTKTGSTMSDDFTLRGETTTTLAKISQNLSEENEAILAIVSRSMAQMREMSGWDDGRAEDAQINQQQPVEDMANEMESVIEHMRNILNNPSFVPIDEVVVREEEINRLKDGWVKMETRWRDAMRLIDGWRKRMAAGGSPIGDDELKLGFKLGSVHLSDVSRLRDSGELALPPLSEDPAEAEHGEIPSSESLHLVPAPDADEEHSSDSESDIYGDDGDGGGNEEAEEEQAGVEENAEGSAEPEPQEEAEAQVEPEPEAEPQPEPEPERESSPLPEPPQLSPLRKSESAGNRGSQTMRRTRTRPTNAGAGRASESQDTQTTTSANNTQKRAFEMPSRRPTRIASRVAEPKGYMRPQVRTKAGEAEPKKAAVPAAGPKKPVQETAAKPKPAKPKEERNGPHTNNTLGKPTPRKPFPRPAEPVSQQSPLTMSNIAAKLAASEREADAARVRAKLKAARKSSGKQLPEEADPVEPAEKMDPEPAPAAEEGLNDNVENVDPVKQDPAIEKETQLKPEKRKRDVRMSKRNSRRRSTLSPWELETLMSGNKK